jgi:hypothetical protein
MSPRSDKRGYERQIVTYPDKMKAFGTGYRGWHQDRAIVSFPHMARPLLVSIDPAPAELRMVD